MSIKKILINLIPPSAGGGLQNALSFIIQLSDISELNKSSIIVCRDKSDIHVTCKRLGLTYHTIKPGFWGRVWYELLGGFIIAKHFKVKIIFSLFGNPPIISPGFYKISGFALSNLLHPEINFWGNLSPIKKLIKKTKDIFRLWASRRSNEIIFETDYLAERARKGKFQDRIIHVVHMEPSALILTDNNNYYPTPYSKTRMNLLVLSGPHPNKRILKLAPIIANLEKLRKEAELSPPTLTVTVPVNHPHSIEIKNEFNKAGVSHLLHLIGSVPQADVVNLLKSVDGIINIAQLESFSNNWVEAWSMGLPLISTDADWARASCGEAAIYIDPLNPQTAAQYIFDAYSNTQNLERLKNAGFAQLQQMSKQGKKIDAYWKILKSALETKT